MHILQIRLQVGIALSLTNTKHMKHVLLALRKHPSPESFCESERTAEMCGFYKLVPFLPVTSK